MIEALTIIDIEKEIKNIGKGDYIALLLLCRYRKDPQSVPWRIAVNAMNFHHESGPDVDIYVPGFSFYGRSMRTNLGEAVILESSEPLGYYYPSASAEAARFLRKNMRGLGAGSSLSLVALEVINNKPIWSDGVAMDLSRMSATAAEERIMEVIDACKVSIGYVSRKNVKYFKNSFRLSQLASYLDVNGWSVVSGFSGVGALLLTT